jgi:hypothetical protein
METQDQDFPDIEDEIVASETPVSEEPISEAPTLEPVKEVQPKMIEIVHKDKVLRHVQPQESKYWHFTFINQADQDQLTRVLETIPNYNLTVTYGLTQNSPDIILYQDDEIVGKIHLLLCDKRDANLPAKYYCKIYLYHFQNQDLFNNVEVALVNFFENFKSAAMNRKEKGGAKIRNKRSTRRKSRRSKKTHKRRK